MNEKFLKIGLIVICEIVIVFCVFNHTERQVEENTSVNTVFTVPVQTNDYGLFQVAFEINYNDLQELNDSADCEGLIKYAFQSNLVNFARNRKFYEFYADFDTSFDSIANKSINDVKTYGIQINTTSATLIPSDEIKNLIEEYEKAQEELIQAKIELDKAQAEYLKAKNE